MKISVDHKDLIYLKPKAPKHMTVKENVSVWTAVAAVGGIITTIALLLFSGSEGLLITARFEVDFEPDYNLETVQHEKMTIKNVGWAQAKNAEAYIISDDLLRIATYDCPEANELPNEQSNTIKLEFKKISTNIDCFINFESSKIGTIHSITVTADDAPGYKLINVVDKTPEIIESSRIIQELTSFTTIVTILATIASLVTTKIIRK